LILRYESHRPPVNCEEILVKSVANGSDVHVQPAPPLSVPIASPHSDRMNQNGILLRRRNKVIVPQGNSSLPPSYRATINRNLENLGYTISQSILEALTTLSVDNAVRFYEELVTILKEARGRRDYKPMYPNFPRQVMEAPAAELYLNAVIHYLTAWGADVVGGGRSEIIWLPDYEKKSRESLKDGVRLTVIEVGTEDDLHRIFASVISSKTSISETEPRQ
jgi:hypothetical protein